MKLLPLVLVAAGTLVLDGCTASRTVVPSPAGGGSSPPAHVQAGMSSSETVNSSEQSVELSAKYVRIQSALPEAKGALAFLSDDAGLRVGTVSLTRKQAEAAQRELCRLIGTELRSTSTVTMAAGCPAKMRFHETAAIEETSSVKITVGGVEHGFQVREVGVSLEVTPQVAAAGVIQMDTLLEVTNFDGFVEYGGVSVALPSSSASLTDPEKRVVKVPTGFYQPIFSTQSMKSEVRLAEGRVLVMKAEHKIRTEPEEKARAGKETTLLFLTASVQPLKR